MGKPLREPKFQINLSGEPKRACDFESRNPWRNVILIMGPTTLRGAGGGVRTDRAFRRSALPRVPQNQENSAADWRSDERALFASFRGFFSASLGLREKEEFSRVLNQLSAARLASAPRKPLSLFPSPPQPAEEGVLLRGRRRIALSLASK